MTELLEEYGLYWQPLGGNNIDQISGHSYRYTDVSDFGRTTIIVDLGKFDNHQALGIKNSSAAVPDIRALLNGEKDRAEAIFITHSHPDHLNGIVHYIKAGYALPKLYAGKYTFMILEDLYKQFEIPKYKRPKQVVIDDGDVIKIGTMEIEVLSSSHTCFDSFGFVIKTPNTTIYHTGDMKIDSSTYFRKSTNTRRLKQLAGTIKFAVADFYGVYDDGYAIKEVTTFKKLVQLIKKSRKNKIFLPVYPTHPEMYIIAFLAALKLKKNVVFFGNPDFYSYLNRIMDYGISFDNLAKNRIKVIYTHNRDEIATLDENYVVIGTYNHVSQAFDANAENCFGIITAKTFFNPLKGQLNAHNIKFTDVTTAPELQGFGHGFLKDYEYLNFILAHPTFIPTHCPVFVIENFRELARYLNIKMLDDTPKNNEIFRLVGKKAEKISELPAKWLVVVYNGDFAYLTEVFQKATSGMGFLKRTISNRRCLRRFQMFLQRRKRGDTEPLPQIHHEPFIYKEPQ